MITPDIDGSTTSRITLDGDDDGDDRFSDLDLQQIMYSTAETVNQLPDLPQRSPLSPTNGSFSHGRERQTNVSDLAGHDSEVTSKGPVQISKCMFNDSNHTSPSALSPTIFEQISVFNEPTELTDHDHLKATAPAADQFSFDDAFINNHFWDLEDVTTDTLAGYSHTSHVDVQFQDPSIVDCLDFQQMTASLSPWEDTSAFEAAVKNAIISKQPKRSIDMDVRSSEPGIADTRIPKSTIAQRRKLWRQKQLLVLRPPPHQLQPSRCSSSKPEYHQITESPTHISETRLKDLQTDTNEIISARPGPVTTKRHKTTNLQKCTTRYGSTMTTTPESGGPSCSVQSPSSDAPGSAGLLTDDAKHRTLLLSKNRIAANKYRLKTKMQYEKLQTDLQHNDEKNARLRRTVAEVEMKIQWISTMLDEHTSSSACKTIGQLGDALELMRETRSRRREIVGSQTKKCRITSGPPAQIFRC